MVGGIELCRGDWVGEGVGDCGGSGKSYEKEKGEVEVHGG